MKTFKRFYYAVILLASLASSTGVYALAMTDVFENSLVDWLLRGQTYTPPTTVYVALFTVCPTDSTAGTEVSGGSYARVSVASTLTNWSGTQSAGSASASSGSSGTISNNVTISFPAATADWGAVNCFGLMSASSGGILYIYTALTTPRTITSGATASFAAGTLTFQIDN